MTIASAFEPEHINVVAAQNFKEKMESRTDGAFSVEISPGAAYGAEDEIGEIVNEGGVEAHAAGSFPFFQYASEYWFFGNPFVLENYDHLLAVWDTDLMDEGRQQLIENGNQRALGQPIYRGLRHFTSNQPIREPGDLQNLALRLPELDPWVQIWQEVGAEPTPVALDELYTALQTGTVDASEGGAEQIFSFNLYEVQSHLSLTGHLVANGNLYMNEDFYQGLSDEYQTMVMEVGQESTAEAAAEAQEREEELIDQLAENGMTIVEDVDRDAFWEAGRPAVQNLFETTWAGSYEEIQALAPEGETATAGTETETEAGTETETEGGS